MELRPLLFIAFLARKLASIIRGLTSVRVTFCQILNGALLTPRLMGKGFHDDDEDDGYKPLIKLELLY